MILSQKQIEIVADFVKKHDDYDLESGHFTFPHFQTQLKEMLGHPFTLTYIKEKEEYAYIWHELLNVTLYRDGKFSWRFSLNKEQLPIEQMREAMRLAQLLIDFKSSIEEAFAEILPVIEHKKYLSAILSRAKWCLRPADSFFNFFSKTYKPIDTDTKLKELYKIKIEDWDESFHKIYGGKNETIKWYRKVFDDFLEQYNKIEEFNSKFK